MKHRTSLAALPSPLVRLLLLSLLTVAVIFYGLNTQHADTQVAHVVVVNSTAVVAVAAVRLAAAATTAIAVPTTVTGVIYYLTRPLSEEESRDALYRSLIALHRFFNCKYRYPIVVFTSESSKNKVEFHRWVQSSLWPTACDLDANYSYSYHNSSSSSSGPRNHSLAQTPPYSLTYTDVTFTFPSSLNHSSVPLVTSCSDQGLGYRSMCRWQALGAVDEVELSGYEFAWRFDNDGELSQPVTFDPFLYMKQHDQVYGFNAIMADRGECVIGLYQDTVRYMQQHHASNTTTALPIGNFLNLFRDTTLHFYNNFEISRFDFWRSAPVRAYLDYIDSTSSIYTQRWGDAPIKSLAVSMFVPLQQVHYFGDIAHNHQGVNTGEKHTSWVLKDFDFHRPKRTTESTAIAFKGYETGTQAAVAEAVVAEEAMTEAAEAAQAAASTVVADRKLAAAESVKVTAVENARNISKQQFATGAAAAAAAWLTAAACFWLYNSRETTGEAILSVLQTVAVFLLFRSKQHKQQAR